MKLGKVVNALPALQKLANENLTPKTLYWVSKLLRKLEKEIDVFNTSRTKLLKDLGKEIEPGKYKIPDDNIPEFENRFNELMDIDIEETFNIVKIPTTEDIKLSYNDLQALDGFIELVCDDDKGE